MGLPTPDWSLELAKPKVPAWHAVALASNVSPNAVPKWDDLKARTYWQPGKPMYEKLQVVLAVGRDKDSPFDGVSYYNFDAYSDVRLTTFVGWAKSVGWQLPDQLAAVAEAPVVRKGKWPWGDYENENLRLLERAVAKYWATWKEGDEQPINKTVQGFLQDLGMQKEPAEQVASLIRPDQAKKGGRPPGRKTG
jgi:hypothetical protein